MKNMRKCIFFQSTKDGERCIFIAPEQWKIVRDRYINFCLNNGIGCPILSNVYSKYKV